MKKSEMLDALREYVEDEFGKQAWLDIMSGRNVDDIRDPKDQMLAIVDSIAATAEWRCEALRGAACFDPRVVWS